MQFKVTKQYQRGTETFDKNFTKLTDAKQYVQSCAEADAAMRVQVIYRIYEFDDLMEAVDSGNLEKLSQKNDAAETGSQGMGNSASFRPTPFQTAPRPKGALPNNWKVDPDEEKKEEK